MGKKTVWLLRGVLLVGFGLAVFFTCRLFSTAPGDRHSEVAPPQLSTAAPTASVTPAPADVTMARARELLSHMTLPEKVGQMFFVRCPESGAVESAAQYALGGYLLFARDFQGHTAEDMGAIIQTYQNASKLSLFIGVDEEGGPVTRVSRFSQYRLSPFLSPQALYQQNAWEAIVSDTTEKAALLKHLGINVNFAPVCDVSTDPADYMYDRSFGKNAKETSLYIEKVVEVMDTWKLGSVLKHFPGYGNNGDTHTDIVRDSRPYSHFTEQDFLPFAAGIQHGADMVLVSHNIVESMDKERPASLSPEVHRILRENLKFDGVIITDDLYMDAIRKFTGGEEAAVSAVQAGNDMLCCTDFTVQVPAVLDAVAQGKITEERIDESVLRILRCKLELGILH